MILEIGLVVGLVISAIVSWIVYRFKLWNKARNLFSRHRDSFSLLGEGKKELSPPKKFFEQESSPFLKESVTAAYLTEYWQEEKSKWETAHDRYCRERVGLGDEGHQLYEEEIRKRYKQLAVNLHPDRYGTGSTEIQQASTECFQELGKLLKRFQEEDKGTDVEEGERRENRTEESRVLSVYGELLRDIEKLEKGREEDKKEYKETLEHQDKKHTQAMEDQGKRHTQAMEDQDKRHTRAMQEMREDIMKEIRENFVPKQ